MKTLLFLLSFCVSTLHLKAHQPASTSHVVLLSGETIYGEVVYLDQNFSSTRYLKKIRVTTPEGKRKKYRTDKVAAFHTNGEDFEILRLEQSANLFSSDHAKYHIDPKNGDTYILQRINAGALSHYTYSWWDQGDALEQSMDLFRKQGDAFFVRATQGMLGLKRKLLANYFSDCPDLAEMIRDKSLKNADEVVTFYNVNCQ
jgi:hypothetical protein